MPETDFKKRTISFSDHDFQDLSHTIPSFIYLLGIMLYPENYQKAMDYSFGGLVAYIRELDYSPEQMNELLKIDNNLLYLAITRTEKALEAFHGENKLYGNGKYTLFQKGLILGRIASILLTYRENPETVFHDIHNNPALIGINQKTIPVSTLQGIWETQKNTAHFWAAYLISSKRLEMDCFNFILDSEDDKEAGEEFNLFLKNSSTLYKALAEKEDPTVSPREKKDGKNFKMDPLLMWQALDGEKSFPTTKLTIGYSDLSLDEAAQRKNLPFYKTDKGYYVDDTELFFSVRFNRPVFYKIFR